ncbi:sigma-70 region 4 domain-containing protein [Candidatus Woesearchaeota archaeon]|nr:sigma-70 region 4 domain-containing protein [Candidatus Woesearchaeota archaeon]
MDNIDIDALFENLRKKGFSYSEILDTIKKDVGLAIPVKFLNNRKLGMLEAAVIYLKDEKKLSYHEIAEILNRNDRTIWASYNKGKKKL